MSVRIDGAVAVVVRKADAPERVNADGAVSDDDVVAMRCASRGDAEALIDRLADDGVSREHVAIIDGQSACAWLDVQRDDDALVITLQPFQRFDFLSTSDSGLHYVRERRGGMTRVLTDSELADFSGDPRPCPDCGEQFGCDHYNTAGEPLLSDAEVDAEVPREWVAFAKDYGISRRDLERLTLIDRAEGEYRVTVPEHDMRTLELVLLLNEAR